MKVPLGNPFLGLPSPKLKPDRGPREVVAPARQFDLSLPDEVSESDPFLPKAAPMAGRCPKKPGPLARRNPDHTEGTVESDEDGFSQRLLAPSCYQMLAGMLHSCNPEARSNV